MEDVKRTIILKTMENIRHCRNTIGILLTDTNEEVKIGNCIGTLCLVQQELQQNVHSLKELTEVDVFTQKKD